MRNSNQVCDKLPSIVIIIKWLPTYLLSPSRARSFSQQVEICTQSGWWTNSCHFQLQVINYGRIRGG